MPDTVTIRYRGHASSGVFIDATGDEVGHGKTVEVPKDVAEALLLQEDEWEAVSATKSKKED